MSDAEEGVLTLAVEAPATRLDQFLAEAIPTLSRSQIQKLIKQGAVLVGPTTEAAAPVTRPSSSLDAGQRVQVHLPREEPTTLAAEAIPLDVVYEDEHLAVINKEAGMVVHPAQGHRAGTLVNALLARYPDLEQMREADAHAFERPGIVHRLDQDTSGLIVIARTPQALTHLRAQFKARTVEKIYLALVYGQPEAYEGIIDMPLGRDPRHRQKIAVRADGKAARTHYRVLEDFGDYSLLWVGLETGRTHQIRVHLAKLNCPVVGDTVYGRRKNRLGVRRQFLHAWQLAFEHPHTGKPLKLEAPLDKHLAHVLTRLRGG